jgi:hypothetical protein
VISEEQAIKDLDDFLEKNPHLKKDQERITKILEKAHPDNRLEVIMMMLFGEQTALLKNLNELITLI